MTKRNSLRTLSGICSEATFGDRKVVGARLQIKFVAMEHEAARRASAPPSTTASDAADAGAAPPRRASR